MKVKAEMCWHGHGHSVRLTLPCGQRLVLNAPEETWCRSLAIRAKDLIEIETGVFREKIRFI